MRSCAFVAVLLCLAVPTAAGAAQGRAAGAASKPQSAAEAPHAAAHPDDEALFQQGVAARKGRGKKADLRAALEWFSLAGAAGSVAGSVEAARAFETGKGTAVDLDRAGQWWYRAATLGNAPAQARWIELFLSGRIASIGGEAGIGWLSALASAGDVRAALALAGAFETGKGIAPDPARAEHWYREASLLRGDGEARFRLGRMLLARPAAWRVLGDEVWTAKEAEREKKPLGPVWFATRPDTDDEKRTHLRPGIWAGERWLTLAARQGHAEAQYQLGAAMVDGLELPFDILTGTAWLDAAAAQGHALAAMRLGDLAAKGQGLFAKDPVRAWVMYDIAASRGLAAAAEARDAVGRALGGRGLARARQVAQEMRDITGL